MSHQVSALAVATLACVATMAFAAEQDCPDIEPAYHGVGRFSYADLPVNKVAVERHGNGVLVARIAGAVFRFDPPPEGGAQGPVFRTVTSVLARQPTPVLRSLPPSVRIDASYGHSCGGAGCKTRDFGTSNEFVIELPPDIWRDTRFYHPGVMLHELAHVLDDYRGTIGTGPYHAGTDANGISESASWRLARSRDCDIPASVHGARTVYEDFADAMVYWWAVRVLGADDGGYARTVLRHRMAWFDREVRRAAMLDVPLFARPAQPPSAKDEGAGP